MRVMHNRCVAYLKRDREKPVRHGHPWIFPAPSRGGRAARRSRAWLTYLMPNATGLRAYRDIDLLALKLLEPEGILATFSCSGLVSPADLQMTLGWAATDARREVQILETLGQPADHPVLVSFPESAYLHGIIARAV